VRTDAGVEAAVRQAVGLVGGLAGVVGPGDVVVVKPNMVMDAPAGTGMVTDPAVTRAVVRMAREAGAAQVVIAEGTAQYREGDVNRDRFCSVSAFAAAGYDGDGDMVDDVTGAPLVDLNDAGGTDVSDPQKVTRVVVPAGLMRTEYWLPNVVVQADVLISVPVLKNHYLAGVTLSMKNLIGLLPNDLYHAPGNIYGKHSLDHGPMGLDQHIVDVNLARHADFVVVDGQRGMIDGPIGSTILDPPMGVVLAGRDVVAIDTVGALLMGYDPLAIPYIRLGAERGLGQADTGRIQVLGTSVAEARRDFPAPYADSPAVRADSQPPSVAIAALPEGPWAGSVTVVADAGDNDAVARVVFYLDGQWIGDALVPPFQTIVEVSDHTTGLHTVRAVAYDRSLNQSEAAREVEFAAATGSPTSSPEPTATATQSGPVSPERATATPPLQGTAGLPTQPVSDGPMSAQVVTGTTRSLPPGAMPAAITATLVVSQPATVRWATSPASPSATGLTSEPLVTSTAAAIPQDDEEWPGWIPCVAGLMLIVASVGVLIGRIARRRHR
jgi:uncharacterized protein (DUF362 family)